jgi:hypothetical protein
MSDLTPRTDKEEWDGGNCVFASWVVGSDFARELERELNALKASIAVAPESTDSLPPTFKRIALLFTRSCTRTKFAKGEKKAWDRVKDTIKEHDIELLEWFYALDKSVDCDCTWRRVKMPATLLNSLEAQLDQAYAHKEAMRKAKEADPFSQFRT